MSRRFGDDYSYSVGTQRYGQFERSMLPENGKVIEKKFQGMGFIADMDSKTARLSRGGFEVAVWCSPFENERIRIPGYSDERAVLVAGQNMSRRMVV